VKTFHSLLALTSAALLAGCDSESAPPPRVRPVLSAVAEPQTLVLNAFAGAIEPRYSSSLAFRAGGRVIAREVNAGDSVQKGARLAALDPLVFDLAVRDAQAGLANAIAVLDNAAAAEKRYRVLFEGKHTPAQQFEAAQEEKDAAEAAVTRAQSVLEKALEERGYAELTAEYDGVVIAVNTEIGQVVAPGQPVISIARPDAREAVIDVPENLSVQEGSPFEIALQIAPSKRVSGKVREVAPQIHAMTRSRRVKIALESPSADFRLGTTVTAYAPTQTAGQITIPVSAVFEHGGKQQVWIVNSTSKTVALREVNVSSGNGGTAAVKAGLDPGDRVVTAGVHSLEPGQSVKIPEEAPK
jgi:membrane fusion protein, multidrug efflux system